MPELVDVVRVLVEVRRRPEVLADRVPVDVEVVRVGEDEPVDGVEPQDEGRHLERGNQVALAVAGLLGAGASRRRQPDSEDGHHRGTPERSHADHLQQERRRG
jgi:MYXO-CTERM domain-containing protein